MGKECLALVVIQAVLLVVPAAAAQSGQKAHDRIVGEEVVVTHTDSGEELRGRLVDLTPESLAILVDGRRVDVPIDHVLRIDVRTDSVKDGAIIGAVVAGTLAGLSCATYSDYTGPCVVGAVIYSGFGALVGAGIDAMHKGRTPIYVKPAKSGVGLQVKIKF